MLEIEDEFTLREKSSAEINEFFPDWLVSRSAPSLRVYRVHIKRLDKGSLRLDVIKY